MMTVIPTELAIGAVMPDGTIHAGMSPDTGKAMFTTLRDAPLPCTFTQAGEYASNLDLHDHTDWRVPSKAELNVLFQNRAAIGGFDATVSDPRSWYWSSSRGVHHYSGWAQRLSDGYQYYRIYNEWPSALRCVRG
jgi:hypothetical protein